MQTFVGLDCGGTTSRVLAVNECGEAVFRGQSGPANLLSTPSDLIERNLRRACEACPAPTAVCGAFAGLVGPEQRALAEELLRGIFPSAEIRAEPDYAAAHAAAPAGTHVTIIAGTGSLVCGRGAQGQLIKAGGRGYLLGDEGSGFRFGQAALIHFLRHPAARSTALTNAVEGLFGALDEATIVGAVYGASAPQPLLARLLPAFAADLDARVAYAESTVAQEASKLAESVTAYVETHLTDLSILRMALAGGVWRATERFEQSFREALESRMPGRTIEIGRITRPPVEGAVILAKELKHGNRE